MATIRFQSLIPEAVTRAAPKGILPAVWQAVIQFDRGRVQGYHLDFPDQGSAAANEAEARKQFKSDIEEVRKALGS